MNKRLTAALALMASTFCLSAQSTNDFALTPNLAIPDGSPVGLTEQFGVSGLSGLIGDVSVNLDITGGFNGDLYAYLLGPQGQLAILLNRVGLSGSNPIGYGDAGMNVTLDGALAGTSSADIHNYQSGSYTLAGGQLTGTWAADGRNIDPQSSGAVFDSAPATSGLNLFSDTNPNGTWTFFVADLISGGGTATLNNLNLSIVTVPEPQTLALTASGGLALLFLFRRKKS